MTKQGIVYQIRNLSNNHLYIGSTTNANKRWDEHKLELSRNTHCNHRLQADYNLFGKFNFTFEVLKECSIDRRFEWEQYYIDITKPIYNIRKRVFNYPSRDEESITLFSNTGGHFLFKIKELTSKLTGGELMVLTLIHSLSGWETNIVRLTSSNREYICKITKIEDRTLDNTIGRLKRKRLILRHKGQYIVNPEYFWNGSITKKATLLAELNASRSLAVQEEPEPYNKTKPDTQ